jgi:predicted nucleic acid-binding Zn ribbon protein
MFGSGFMANATSSMKYNKSLVSKKNKYFKSGDDFFEVSEINQENSTLETKTFENKLSTIEREKLLEKLEKRKKRNLIFDYFVIFVLVLIIVSVFLFFYFY